MNCICLHQEHQERESGYTGQGIYKRKKNKTTRTRPRKRALVQKKQHERVREKELAQESKLSTKKASKKMIKKKRKLFFLDAFLVESVFS